MSHTGAFGITTPEEFFNQIVMPQYQDFLNNTASPRSALLCVIVAYHMYEWANNREKFDRVKFNSRYPGKLTVREYFNIARLLTNNTKHFLSGVETCAQGGFSPSFSDSFARPLIIVQVSGFNISANTLLKTIIDFWVEQEVAGAF